MNITMIVSFVIIYEKFCEPLSARLGLFNFLPDLFDKIMLTLTRLNHAIFTVYIPRLIIKLRYFLVTVFFILGVIGLVLVFHNPKLSPPKSRRYQFFQLTHPFERFEYQMRDEFLSYINEDKDNVTNPLLIFAFGVEETDLVHPFYPDRPRYVDNKTVIYNKKINFYDPKTLRWFDTFLRDLNRSDLFTNVHETYAQWLTIGRRRLTTPLSLSYSPPSRSTAARISDNERHAIPAAARERVLRAPHCQRHAAGHESPIQVLQRIESDGRGGRQQSRKREFPLGLYP